MNKTLTEKKVAVYSDQQDQFLINLAQELQLPLLVSRSENVDFYLLRVNDVLCLQRGDANITGGASKSGDVSKSGDASICVDFSSGEANYRREQGGGKNQPIGRAIGLNKHQEVSVLDATAGLGGDAFVLACLGCQVLMLERSPIISALLADGLRRAALDDNILAVVNRMKLENIEAECYLSQIPVKPDVIYLDPMYPHRKKSAKVKKEMQMLQKLLGHHDDNFLLTLALKAAGRRVVVKRPKGADYLNGSAPSHSIESKKTRYDVYMCGI